MFNLPVQRYTFWLSGSAVIAGALLLMIPAWWNGYPLLYPDTGTYLWSGFQRELLIGRPMTYGLFLALTSGSVSLWYALFAQCLIISWVLYQSLSLVIEQRTKRPVLHLASIILLSCTTGFALISAQLIPDAFTPLIYLLLVILLFGEPGRVVRMISATMLVFVLLTHNSHGMIVLLTLLLLVAVKLVFRKAPVRWPRIAVTGALVLGALVMTPVVHYLVGGEFAVSKGEHVFLLNRTREAGVLQQYLARHCGEKDYELCAYLDVLDGDFMWDAGRSPLYKMGGWEKTETEFNRILSDMLSDPEYASPVAKDIVKSWFRQMITWDFEDPGQMGMNSGPYHPIDTYLPSDTKAMVNARQGQGTLNFSRLHVIAGIIVLLSLAAVFIFLFLRTTSLQVKTWLILLVFFLMANAAVCATFSLAIGRYQARVIWLPVFLTLCLVYPRLAHIFAKRRGIPGKDFV